MRNALLPALLIPALLISACDSSPSESAADTDPLFPLAVGNAWVMQVTTRLLAPEPSVQLDTIRVARDTVVDNETWYEISSRSDFGFAGAENSTDWYTLREDGFWRLDEEGRAVRLHEYPGEVGIVTSPRSGVSYTRVAEDSVLSIEGIGSVRTIPYALRIYYGYRFTDSMGQTYVLEGDTTITQHFSPDLGFVEAGGLLARVDFATSRLIPVGSQTWRLVEFLPARSDEPSERASKGRTDVPDERDPSIVLVR